MITCKTRWRVAACLSAYCEISQKCQHICLSLFYVELRVTYGQECLKTTVK